MGLLTNYLFNHKYDCFQFQILYMLYSTHIMPYMIIIKYIQKIFHTSCYTKTKIHPIFNTICRNFCMVG